MKIKIIDLLNLVYEKKAPKRINVIHGRITESYKFNERLNWYETLDETTLFGFSHGDDLNEEVEIIEERPKKIEKVNIEYDNKEETCKLAYANSCYELNPQEVIILDKIEEIRKVTNYLLKKEDDKK